MQNLTVNKVVVCGDSIDIKFSQAVADRKILIADLKNEAKGKAIVEELTQEPWWTPEVQHLFTQAVSIARRGEKLEGDKSDNTGAHDGGEEKVPPANADGNAGAGVGADSGAGVLEGAQGEESASVPATGSETQGESSVAEHPAGTYHEHMEKWEAKEEKAPASGKGKGKGKGKAKAEAEAK